VKAAFGDVLHKAFVAMKRAEFERVAGEITDVEWRLYGSVV
jgi:glutamine synthetase